MSVFRILSHLNLFWCWLHHIKVYDLINLGSHNSVSYAQRRDKVIHIGLIAVATILQIHGAKMYGHEKAPKERKDWYQMIGNYHVPVFLSCNPTLYDRITNYNHEIYMIMAPIFPMERRGKTSRCVLFLMFAHYLQSIGHEIWDFWLV